MILTKTDENILDDVYTMVRPRYLQAKEADVKETIWMHWLYGTIDAVYRDGQIVAVCRWNVSSDNKTFEVLDLLIKEGENGLRLIKHLIVRNWHRFPQVRFLSFVRGDKYPGRSLRNYSLIKMFHLKEM